MNLEGYTIVLWRTLYLEGQRDVERVKNGSIQNAKRLEIVSQMVGMDGRRRKLRADGRNILMLEVC